MLVSVWNICTIITVHIHHLFSWEKKASLLTWLISCYSSLPCINSSSLCFCTVFCSHLSLCSFTDIIIVIVIAVINANAIANANANAIWLSVREEQGKARQGKVKQFLLFFSIFSFFFPHVIFIVMLLRSLWSITNANANVVALINKQCRLVSQVMSA